MARPIGAVIKMQMRWECKDPPPTVGMFFRTEAGRWYEIISVRRIETEKAKFAMQAIVRGNDFWPPEGARKGGLTWDSRARKKKQGRSPLL